MAGLNCPLFSPSCARVRGPPPQASLAQGSGQTAASVRGRQAQRVPLPVPEPVPPPSAAGADRGDPGGCGSSPGPELACAPCAPRLLSKILSECEDADEIEFLAEGSWRPIRAEKEPSCSPQGPILVLGESPHPACPPRPAWPPAEHCPVPAGTSDANGLPPASSTPGGGGGVGSALAGAGGGAGAAGGPENGKPGADVVDLTLDSSSSSEDDDDDEDEDEDDDEGPRPKRRCPFQKGLVPAC